MGFFKNSGDMPKNPLLKLVLLLLLTMIAVIIIVIIFMANRFVSKMRVQNWTRAIVIVRLMYTRLATIQMGFSGKDAKNGTRTISLQCTLVSSLVFFPLFSYTYAFNRRHYDRNQRYLLAVLFFCCF